MSEALEILGEILVLVQCDAMRLGRMVSFNSLMSMMHDVVS